MNFNGVIFDLDGTLVNSLEDLADSMNTVLRNNHFPEHTTEAYNYFIGSGIRNLVSRTLPEPHKDEQTIAKCFAEMVEIYRENCMNKTRPYDGIPALLDELIKYGLKLAVLSNKADELTKRIVPVLLPGREFSAVMGLSNEATKKPNPAGALQISRQMNIAPDKMLYIGDSGVDMQTANNAGMYAAGACWGFRSREELMKNGARILLEHPSDLIRIL